MQKEEEEEAEEEEVNEQSEPYSLFKLHLLNGLMNGLVITIARRPLVCSSGVLCALQELGRFMELIKRVYGTQ